MSTGIWRDECIRESTVHPGKLTIERDISRRRLTGIRGMSRNEADAAIQELNCAAFDGLSVRIPKPPLSSEAG